MNGFLDLEAEAEKILLDLESLPIHSPDQAANGHKFICEVSVGESREIYSTSGSIAFDPRCWTCLSIGLDRKEYKSVISDAATFKSYNLDNDEAMNLIWHLRRKLMQRT